MGNIYTDVAEEALKGKSQRRDGIELLCRRVGLLVGMDRVLMTMRQERDQLQADCETTGIMCSEGGGENQQADVGGFSGVNI